MKAALIIIDMQNEYCKDEAGVSMRKASEYINEVLPFFREKNLPILWVQDISKSDGVVPGKPGFEIIPELVPREGDIVLHKEYSNSFNKTECAQILKAHGIDTLIVTGYRAENCVLSTYRGALDVDLVPIILRNGIASDTAANIEFVDRISDVISYYALKKMLENCSGR